MTHRMFRSLLCCSLLAGPAAAIAGEPAATVQQQAAALYKQGVGRFKAQDFEAAARLFQQAYDLDPSPVLLYNLARSAEEMGDAEAAIRHYRAYLQRFESASDRSEVERRIRTIEAFQRQAAKGTVVLTELPVGATLSLNGAPTRPDSKGAWRLDPGEYTLRIIPTEGVEWVRVFTLAKGQQLALRYSVATTGGAGISTAEWAGWGALGGGALLLGVGGFYYARAFSAADEFESYKRKIAGGDTRQQTLDGKTEAEDRVGTSTVAAYVLWGAGAAAVGAGAYFLLFQPEDETQSATANVHLGLGTVGISGTF